MFRYDVPVRDLERMARYDHSLDSEVQDAVSNGHPMDTLTVYIIEVNGEKRVSFDNPFKDDWTDCPGCGTPGVIDPMGCEPECFECTYF